MRDKPKIVYLAPENSGVAYYRFWQPLENLKDRGLIELRSWGFDFTGKIIPNPTISELKELCDWADLFIVGRRDDPAWQTMVALIKQFANKPVLLDIDDNIFSVSPYIPAYQGYSPNGPMMEIHKTIAKMVDGIIVSTPALAEVYKEYNKVGHVPNGIRYLYDKKPHEGINIGYMVSHSHLENAQIIEPALVKILRKYNNVRLYYTGAFKGFMERLPKELECQVNYVPFYPLKDYLKYVNQLNLDIGLAPLMDNDFNKCKSNIRILEYWQNRTAVIASPLPEYSSTMTHGFDGYLSQDDEWEHWLDDLILNPERRNYMIQNSLETLKKYDVANFADKYLDIIREMIDGQNSR